MFQCLITIEQWFLPKSGQQNAWKIKTIWNLTSTSIVESYLIIWNIQIYM